MSQQTIEFNVNGSIELDLPKHLSKAKAQDYALELVRKALEEINATSDNAKTQTVSTWADSGSVNVGKLNFRVSHDARKGASSATVKIHPNKSSSHAGARSSEVTTYFDRNTVKLSAYSPNKLRRIDICELAFNKNGELCLSVFDTIDESRHRSEVLNKVAFPNLSVALN